MILHFFQFFYHSVIFKLCQCTYSLKTIEILICIFLISVIIILHLDLPMLVKYIFMYPLLSSLVLHFIGAPFLMFSFAYTVKDVIMNNCHGVDIPLAHCQNIFACFYVSTLLSQKSPTTIMIL